MWKKRGREGGLRVSDRYLSISTIYLLFPLFLHPSLPPSLPASLPSSGSPSKTSWCGHSATPRSGSTRRGAGRGTPEKGGREGGR